MSNRPRSTILACLGLLAALAAGLPASEGRQQLDPIPEISADRLEGKDYRRLIMLLDGAPPERQGLKLTVGVLGDEAVQIWANTKQWGSQRLISRTGSLEMQGTTLQGTAYVLIADPSSDKWHYKSSKQGGLWYGFDIQAQISGDRLQGRFAGRRSNPDVKDREEHEGTLDGVVVDQAAFEAVHPYVEESDFPFWRGREGNGTATDTGWELVEDIADAECLWASEEDELPGTYNIVMGGLGGPVVADGRVYLSYQMPNGPHFDEEWYDKLMPEGPEQEDRIAYYGHLAGDYGASWLRRRTSITADDIVLCVDAQTGLTIWKRVFPAVARNPSYSNRGWSWAKNGPFTTPCVADGKVYTLGGHGAMYCLDATTGEDVWQGKLFSAENADAHLAAAVEAGRMVQRVKHKPRAPDYVTSLCHAEGVIISNENSWRVDGWDAATGEHLWGPADIDGLGRGRGGGSQSGVLMSAGDRTLVVMGPSIIDPRSGEVIWSIDCEKYYQGARGNPCVAGDILVYPNNDKDSEVGLSAWRFSTSGAKLLWTKGGEYCGLKHCTPTAYEGHVYCITRPNDNAPGHVLCIELESGEIVAQVERAGRGEGDFAQLLSSDGRMLVGQQRASWWRTEPSDFERLCEFPAGDSVPNNQSSHPQAMCGGRLYSRGDFNLVCWDLRKVRDDSPPPALGGQ